MPKTFPRLTVGDYRSLLEGTNADQNRGMEFGRLFHQAVVDGEMHENQFSLQAAAMAICGAEWVMGLSPLSEGGGYLAHMTEGAVDSTTFSNITGQIVYTRMMRAWNEADQGITDALFSTTPTRLSGEKIPGIGNIKDESFVVNEGMEIPLSGYSEHYLTTPDTVHHAMRVAVTREAVFFDRTGQVLGKAASIATRIARGKLKNCLRVLYGITNNFNWNGTAYNTYRTGTPSATLWANTAGSSALVDYTDVDAAVQLLSKNVDPDTLERVEFPGNYTLVIPPALRMAAKRIVNATEVEQGGTLSATVPVTRFANPIMGDVAQIVSSTVMQALGDDEGGYTAAQADAVWFLGHPKEAFTYMENWPLIVRRAPPGNLDEHKRGIIADYAASERGVCSVIAPWLMGKFGTP
jgi:hypothetical protein